MDPYLLIVPERFDLMAKYIYGYLRDIKANTNWHKELYKQHIMVFNGGVEHPGNIKTNVSHFFQHFDDTLDSIMVYGFDLNVSIIPVGSNGVIINGAHRLISCFLHNKPVYIKKLPQKGDNYNFLFFRYYKNHVPTGLTLKYSDPMALQYCKLKKETRIVTLFPSATLAHDKIVLSILQSYGKIGYFKSLTLNVMGLLNYIIELYRYENWIGTPANNYQGARQKVRCCLGQSNLRLYTFEPRYPNKLPEMKQKIRDLYKIGNHSCHINDHHHETVRIAKAIYHYNSIHYLNQSKGIFFNKNVEQFDNYRKWLTENFTSEEQEFFCIDGSFVMSLYGLREARDLDFLCFDPGVITESKLKQKPESAELHNDYILQGKYFSTNSIDNIIFHPREHLYIAGIKCCSLDNVRALKVTRREPKDLSDLELMSKVSTFIN